MINCVYCAEPLKPGAQLCWRCNRPMLADCARVHHIGRQFVLGETATGDFAIWHTSGGYPTIRYPVGVGGWAAAAGQFDQWERAERPSGTERTTRALPIGLIVGIIVLTVVYVMYHNYRYSGCLVQPGMFSWPSQCL